MILLLFIRNPRLGQVKTRLARTVGDAEALRIYRILLEKTRQAALGVHAERWLYYTDATEQGDGWPETDFLKKVQHSGDLGERMHHAFWEAFETGTRKALIIGSDCPGLNPEILGQAFDALDHSDFVLGPTPDGGYYLLGMNQLEASVFQDIAWSTETVCRDTLEKIHTLEKTVTLLPVLSDVDTEEDWLRWIAE